MSELNIFEHAIANVNFVKSEEGLMLFVYSTFEVNTDDVKFYIDKKDDEMMFFLHYQSDNIITILLETKELYDQIKEEKSIRVFEIDMVDGDMLNYYYATK